MNARFTAALYCFGIAVLLAPAAGAKPAAHKAAVPKSALSKSAPVALNPAVALVQQYLAARAEGRTDKAYALLSPNSKAQLFPNNDREWTAKSLTSPTMVKKLPPALLPVMALFADIHDTLHFKFRALGPSPDDPAIVLVRAYQVGTSLSTIKTLQVATVADSVVGGALLIDCEKTAALAAPADMQGRPKAWQAQSQSNLKQLATGVLMYAQDHDETLPDADNWVNEIMLYVDAKEKFIFRDPAVPEQGWSYAFNRALSGARLGDIQDPAATVLLFESTKGLKNAADKGESVPVPGRHNGGTNYALADGHVKWVADGIRPSFLLTGK